MTDTGLYTPQPGSRVERVQMAADSAEPAGTDYAVPIPAEEQYVVKTREQRAYFRAMHTSVIGSGQTRKILSRNDLRRSAIISCVSGTVVLCENSDMAQSTQALALTTTPAGDVPGFYMPSGTPGSAIPVEGTEGVIAVATASGAAVVSVVEEWWEN